LRRREPWAVVLEDDALLCPDFCGRVADAVAALEASPDGAVRAWGVGWDLGQPIKRPLARKAPRACFFQFPFLRLLRAHPQDWDVLLVGALGCVNPSGRYGVGNNANAFVAGGSRR